MTNPARKRLRVGHRSERSGINAVRALLERHDLVVEEVAAAATTAAILMST